MVAATKRKGSQERLTVDKYFHLIEHAADGIAILQDGVFKLVNTALARLSGYDKEELLGMPFIRLFVPECRNFVMTRYEDVLAGKGVPSIFTARAVTKDGEVRNIEINAALTHHEGHTAGVIIIRDTTERKCIGKRSSATRVQAEIGELLDALPFYVLLVDATHHIVFANKAVNTALGLDPEHIVGGYCPKVVHGLDGPFPGCPLEEAVKKGNVVVERELHDHVSGRWLKSAVYPTGLRTREGQVVFIHFVQDVTERKQAEEALKESDRRFRDIAENALEWIWEADVSGKYTYASPIVEKILGYKPEEMLEKHFYDLFHPDDRQELKKATFEAFAQKQPFRQFENRNLHKNGEIVWLSTSGVPILDEGGNLLGYRGADVDVTERKNMEQQLQGKNEQLDSQNEELRATEEELQHSQERLERMFESVTDGIVVAALDGTVLKVNESAVQMHGYASDDELMGKRTLELIAPHDRKRKANNVRKALKEGLSRSQEYTLLRADGSEFPAELSTSALKDASGKVIGHITTVRDITERKQAEEREDQLEQELNLASRLASIGQLAAGVAHEINNPLTGVIGFSHLMLSRDIPDDMKQDLQVIHSEAQRVAKIVENLLVFAHQPKTGREYVAVNDIITRVLELRAYEMKVNNIEVETQLDPDLPLTMADTGQLQQVFLNIVLNAEYFMTKVHNKGKLLVKTEKLYGNIRISLTDNGAGISPENLDKIFDPFFTTKEVGKGTGLGLSICHGIITQHKGRIYAQSESGKGATFVIELPIVAEPAQAGKAEKTQKEPQKPRGAKILVVDDEEAILTFLSRLLTEWGHSVETINNADAALERLKTERYSLILLDIKLPGMSGIELYHHIEEIAPALTRRVMFITGDIMETSTRSFLEKARAPHITKPIDIEVLKKMINSILTGGAQRLTV